MRRGWALLAIPAAMAVGLLLAAVPSGHGADEVRFLALDRVPVKAGDSWVQPVPAQGPGLSGIELPYLATGPGTADLTVLIAAPSGAELGRRHLRLGAASWFEGLLQTQQPYGDAAQVVLIDVPPGGGDGVTLAVERAGGSAGLTLFFSRDRGPRVPGLAGRPDQSLALRTEYGGRAPAIKRAGDLLQRAGTWAPPWLPGPALVLLVAVMAIGGCALIVDPRAAE